MKKVILVIGYSYYDPERMASNLKNENNWKILDERTVHQQYIEKNKQNILCLTKWSEPIRNQVIISFLELIENEIENGDPDEGLIITSQFACEEQVRKAYQSVLEEHGCEVGIVSVETKWTMLLIEALSPYISLKEIAKNWSLFNQQFNRQYTPLSDSHPNAVIVSAELITQKDVPGAYELIVLLDSLQSRGYEILVIDHSDNGEKVVESFKHLGFHRTTVFNDARKIGKMPLKKYKTDLFWTFIANHYKVKLVIESDASCIFQWKKIGLPVISLSNIFSVENLE